MENLKIKYNGVMNKPTKIDFNFEEMKTELTKKLEKYQGLVVTCITIQEGKKTKAELNKLKKDIEDERKRLKREYSAPYDEFATKVKELVSLINEPINLIDTQVKNFEEQLKEEKKELVSGIYDTLIGDLEGIIPLERIFDAKWLNATTSKKSIQEDIEKYTNKVNTDLMVIENLNSEFKLELLSTYENTLDLQQVMIKNNRLAELKQAKEQAEKENEEQKRIQRELEAQQPKEETVEELIEQIEEPVYKEKTITVVVNREQLEKLSHFLNDNGIIFKEV